MIKWPVLTGSFVLPLALLAALPGCQDYAYEELPSSVIREKRHNVTIAVSQRVDILFVMDNSRSMVGEQTAIAQSFSAFTNVLDEKFGADKYRIAVITTGMYSDACKDCPPDNPNYYSCMNDSGETGRFQDRLGTNIGTIEDPEFQFVTDANCKVVESAQLESCFYNPGTASGTIFVGINGCGYERGLAPIRAALSSPLKDAWNGNFLEDDATLAVVVVSDEEDCGEVGDVTEDLPGVSGKVCYYASKGEDPEGTYSDPSGKLYQLTPVREYYDFLVGLKGGRKGLVKFAAIVGVTDPSDPSATEINFESPPTATSDVLPACTTPGCTSASGYCDADPGTRYVQLAQLFGLGENGFVDTICQQDFSETLKKLGTFVSCPREFKLTETILDPGLANILINDVEVPRYSCDTSTQENVIECNDAMPCATGNCVETWTYVPPEDIDPPDPGAPGGIIKFAPHYDPCKLITGGDINIELVYVTD